MIWVALLYAIYFAVAVSTLVSGFQLQLVYLGRARMIFLILSVSDFYQRETCFAEWTV